EARDLQPLPMFDRRNIISGFEQTGLRPGIEPGHAAAKKFHVQLVLLEIDQIQICDLKFPARGGSQAPAKLNDAPVVNIEPGNSEMVFWFFRLCFQAERASVGSEFDHPVSLRIAHLITENATPVLDRERLPIEIEFPVKDVVAENERRTEVANEISANQKCL